MEALIPFILFIAVWILLYKYLVNKKQKGKIISHILGFSISFLVFIVSIIIVSPTVKHQQNNIEEQVEEHIKDEPKKAILTQKEPIIKTSKLKPDSAEYAFASFINAWNNKDYKEMNKFTQLRWKENEKNPEDFLKNFYNLKNLESAKILKIEKNGTAAYKITANIVYTINLIEEKKMNVSITGMVINENNIWGVNPISTIKEDER